MPRARPSSASVRKLEKTPMVQWAVLSLSACDMKSNLDDMHTSTVQMEKTTDEVEKHSDSIDNQTGELYDALRQGDSLQSRRSAMANLISNRDPLRKLSEAAKYFMAFEYNLWSGYGKDITEQKRLALASLAAQEFFKDIQQFIPGGEMKADPFAGQLVASEDTNMVNSFNALAATLEYKNPKQVAKLAERSDLKAISMLSMIEESLLAKADIESGRKRIQDYPGYVKEVLFSEREAVYLLQARYNYLPSLVIGKATKAQYSKLTGARMLLTAWTLDLATLNTVQIAELTSFLQAAQSVKAVLVKIGEPAVLDGMLLKMFKNMNAKKSLGATSSERNKLELEFILSANALVNP